jgi:hypothetical protein
MKILNNVEYHVDKINGKFDKDKFNIYFHKNFQGDCNYVNDCVSILDNPQPTEDTVRGALMWGTGYGGDLDYKIKISNCIFSSSISVTIAHPTTGYDKNVVILKKVSKNFNDVLITRKEIEGLYKLCRNKKEKKDMHNKTMMACISMLLDTHKGLKVNYQGKSQLIPTEGINKIKNVLFSVSNLEEITKHIDFLISNKKRYLDVELNESQSSQTTAQFHKGLNNDIVVLEEFKNTFSPIFF